MIFHELLRDTVTLLKQNGESVEDIKASVQKNKIFILRSDLLIESGDLIRRVMSNGAEETYKVIDPGFREGFSDIPAGYQMDVIKLGLPEARSAVQNITYNISGTNNRINQNSTDNSINIAHINPKIQERIDRLREEIRKLQLSRKEEMASYEIVDAIENQFQSDTPSKTVVKTLISALPNAANIASIGSFILACL